ncbi:MAG: hypothetical protein VXA34_00920 [Gammaproteobacteria bacterium]
MTSNNDHYGRYRQLSWRLAELQAELDKTTAKAEHAERESIRGKQKAERIRMTMRATTRLMNKHAEHIL